MPLNLPNLVTLLRILLIPLIVGVFYLPETWLGEQGKNIAATAIFIVARNPISRIHAATMKVTNCPACTAACISVAISPRSASISPLSRSRTVSMSSPL